MSKKSKQHTVPRVYLRNFCDPAPPRGWPAERPFTPSLWVHSRDLRNTPKRSATKNVAWARDIYNLRGDDPEHPWLEEALGKLENSFAAAIQSVMSGGALSMECRTTLALFVGALHERTEGMLGQRQALFDQLFEFTRQLEGAEDDSSGALGDIGKRQFASFASAFAKVSGPHSVILENATPLPFITSDSPVSYRQLHADELLKVGMNPEWLYQEIPRSARRFFIFCPLSPRHAFISSPFFPPNEELLRRRTSEVRLAFAFNELTRSSADVELYSSSSQPYGSLVDAVIANDKRRSGAEEEQRSGLTIYTSRERYWLPATAIAHGSGSHVLTGQLTFRTNDLATLRAVANDGEMTEITYVEGGSSGGMRGAWFVQVALNSETESIIENGPIRQV
jgi:hypothetical protein